MSNFLRVDRYLHRLDRILRQSPLLFVLLLLVAELVLNVLIIKKIKYTEIDWIAYMQEVTGFLGGRSDYLQLYGDTGPLVYPAGFVYVYSILRYLTEQGTNILFGKYVTSYSIHISLLLASFSF